MAKPKSKGTVIQKEIATIFTTIAGVRELTAPDAEVGTFDKTSLDSSGPGKEKGTTGWVEGGTVSFTLFFDPVATSLQALTDDITSPPDTAPSWKIVWSDAAATEWAFAAFVTKCTPKATLDDGLLADAELMLDGIATYPT